VAAGSDAQLREPADLWLRGDLIDQPFSALVPWPNARWTFTPLGRPRPPAIASCHSIHPACRC
jgi:hypothetical protein